MSKSLTLSRSPLQLGIAIVNADWTKVTGGIVSIALVGVGTLLMFACVGKLSLPSAYVAPYGTTLFAGMLCFFLGFRLSLQAFSGLMSIRPNDGKVLIMLVDAMTIFAVVEMAMSLNDFVGNYAHLVNSCIRVH